MKYIKKFNEISIDDIGLVGGKNASLGYMITHLTKAHITIPDGFAITATAYWHYITSNALLAPMQETMAQLTDIHDNEKLKQVGLKIRTLLLSGTIPADLVEEITVAYQNLCKQYNQNECDVAVRSSATAEDLPGASFAGQQETFLHIRGIQNLLEACKKCIASLFTDRAIVYRAQQGFDQFKVALSVGVQKMVRSDKGSSGVAFSLDTETGFKEVVLIESSYGLGESIVQGLVTPDSFMVHKPTLLQGFTPIIKKKIGSKLTALVYGSDGSVVTQAIPTDKECLFSITDQDILTIARAVIHIEDFYSTRANAWTPMDIEWAKDGLDDIIYILQARPETIYGKAANPDSSRIVSTDHKIHTQSGATHSPSACTNVTPHTITTYTLQQDSTTEHQKKLLVIGQSIGNRIVSGKARIIKDPSLIAHVQEGDIIVTEMTDPDWVPVMKRAAGIITQQGGRTCHAAIVSRELGITAIVGAPNALEIIKNGQEITLDCSSSNQGFVYDGRIPFETHTYELDTLPKTPVTLMVNIADPDSAFSTSFLPVEGVGLARIEFIIANSIQVHPLALLHPQKITCSQERSTIDTLSAAYPDKVSFFVDTLAQGIGLIAAAFYPRPVVVRLSDFKTNEYRHLIGGSYFEPQEENPMIGLRGASRYCHEQYRDAFALECQAIKKVRSTMGLTNVSLMIPFVRTPQEARETLDALAHNGLQQGVDNLRIIMMCEIPSNVILIDEFSTLFDGFSIGSNDLTQLTLGVDRDSPLVAPLFNEQDKAMLTMFTLAIEGAKRNKRHISICGQGPSDYPALADFLINKGIDALSLNADAIMPFLMRLSKKTA